MSSKLQQKQDLQSRSNNLQSRSNDLARSEHDEQAAVVHYLQIKYPDTLFWATPNGAGLSGGGRSMNKLKAEGFLPGVSDLIIFEPRGGYSALFVEMKKANGGNGASDNQLWFIREVEARGALGVVSNGADEAIAFIDEYLGGKICLTK